MLCCGGSSSNAGAGVGGYGDSYPQDGQYDPEPPSEPAYPPDSPTWKLPPFPAPALPPLTRQNKIIITQSQFVDDPEQAQKTKRHVLNGSGEAMSIVFDVGESLDTFLPEVKKLFSLAFSISSIELHTANLDVEAGFLQNFLETLPSNGELRAFSLVVAKDTPLVFSTISGLMYRNPKLLGMRLWGVDLTVAGVGNQYYPSCQLLRVDMAHCRFHPEQLNVMLGSSKDTLLCMKFERLIGVSGTFIARAVKNYGQNVQMLTIILPGESASEMDMTATYLVGDTASRFPKALKYLHLGGLAASDNLFGVTPTSNQKPGEAPKSHLSSLVALRLDDCPRLTCTGLFGAIRHGHLPNMLRLHAYWLDNEEAYSDVDVWKAFAASQDISINLQTDGLVWLSASKEGPSFGDEAGSKPKTLRAPKPAYIDPRSAGRVQNVARPMMAQTYPPNAYLQPSIPYSSLPVSLAPRYGANAGPPRPTSQSRSRSRRGSRSRSKSRDSYISSDSSPSSSSADSDAESSNDSSSDSSDDHSAYRSTRSRRTGASAQRPGRR